MVKPQGYRVLVELEDYTNDVLVLTSNYKEEYQAAIVRDIGDGYITAGGKVIKPPVKIGDRVIVTQTGGTIVSDGDTKYQIVPVDNIVGGVE